jgi:hypothetical protein
MRRDIRVVFVLLAAASMILPAQQPAPPYEGPVTQVQSLNLDSPDCRNTLYRIRCHQQ